MLLYLDNDFCCHMQQNEQDTYRPCEVPELNGKCRTYVEGMRCVPDGETWTSANGEQFSGFMLTPWKDSAQLEIGQSIYEDVLAQTQPQIDDVLVALVEV